MYYWRPKRSKEVPAKLMHEWIGPFVVVRDLRESNLYEIRTLRKPYRSAPANLAHLSIITDPREVPENIRRDIGGEWGLGPT